MNHPMTSITALGNNMLESLQKVMLPDVKIDFSTDDGVLILKENKKESKIKKLYIQSVPEQSFAFTLDYEPKGNSRWFKQLSCYVNPATDKINKGCDLVVVTYKNNQWRILILDMKSDKPNISDTTTQLLNSELYVRYIVSMIENHYGIDIRSLNINYQRTMITTKIRKGATYKPNEGRYESGSFLPCM